MKKFIFIPFIAIAAFFFPKQESPVFFEKITDPASYTAGTFVNWSFDAGVGAQDHGFFKAVGFDAAPDSLKRVVIHFEGDGETNSSGQHSQSPGKILQDAGTNWNGQVTRPDGKTVYFCVFTVYNTNNSWVYPYVQAINYFFANTTNLPDTSLHKCYIMTGFSGGPFRAYSSLLDGGFTRSNIFGFLGMVSPTDFTPTPLDISTLSANKYTMVWRNQGDANGGTPLTAAQHLFQYSTGSKQLVTPAGGSHSADQFFSIAGTDSSTNRWYLMAMYNPPTSGGGGGGGTPSSNRIYLNRYNVVDMNMLLGKSAETLVDGLTTTGKGMNINGVDDRAMTVPGEFWIVFDSLYHNLKIDLFDDAGSSSNLEFTLVRERSGSTYVDHHGIDSVLSFIANTGNYQVWSTQSTGLATDIEDVDSIRSIRITVKDQDAWDVIKEIRVFGDAQGVARSRYYTGAAINKPDKGIKGFGIGQLGNQDMNRVGEMGGSTRIIQPAVQINTPGQWTTPLKQSAFTFNNDGVYDGWNANYLNYARANNIDMHIALTAGSYKGVSQSLTNTYSYNDWITVFANSRAYIEPGADSTQYSAWEGYGHLGAFLTYFYTVHTNNWPGTYTLYGGSTTRAQGGIAELANFNEFNKDWLGRSGRLDAYSYYASMKVFYDSVKSVNSNAIVLTGALTSAASKYLNALNWVHYLKTRNYSVFPADGFSFNNYMSNQYGGQQFNVNDTAISPERFRVDSMLSEWQTRNTLLFGNLITHWTELGYDTVLSSPFNVPVIAGKYLRETVADFFARAEFEVQCAGNAIDKMFWYWYSSDGSPYFQGMVADSVLFQGPGGSYSGVKRMPVGYYMQQRKVIEANYPYHASKIVNGDSTGVSVSVKTNLYNANKKLFQVKRGTTNNSTSSYTLNLGAGATSAKLIEWNYYSSTPTETVLTITGTSVTVTAAEKKVYIEATYNQSALPPVRWNRRIVGK